MPLRSKQTAACTPYFLSGNLDKVAISVYFIEFTVASHDLRRTGENLLKILSSIQQG